MSGSLAASALIAGLLPALAPAPSSSWSAQLAPEYLSPWVRIRLSASELAVAPALGRIREGTADPADERRLQLALLGLTRGVLPSDPRAVVLLFHLLRRLQTSHTEWELPAGFARRSLEGVLRRPLGAALRQLAHFELALLSLGRRLGSTAAASQMSDSEQEVQVHLAQVIWGAEDDEWSASGLLLAGLLAWERGQFLAVRRDFDAALTLRVPQRQKAEIALLMALLEVERNEESSAARWFDAALALRSGTAEISEPRFGGELPWDPALGRYLSEWPSWRRPDASLVSRPSEQAVEPPTDSFAASRYFRAARRLQRILFSGQRPPADAEGSD